MTILNIETSTNCCSAAITIDGKAVAWRENIGSANHARELPVFISELLDEAKQNGWHLDAVALSQGPGSYTGLRIGASTAKGLCYGLSIPLIPIDTLQVLCLAAKAQCATLNKVEDSALFCPMLDARRMEVYTAFYAPQTLERTDEIKAKVVDEHTFEAELQQYGAIYFFGNGSDKCRNVIVSPKARFIDGIVPLAQYMGQLAEREDARQLDVKQMAYFEPFYLKDFIPAPSHVKGLQ